MPHKRSDASRVASSRVIDDFKAIRGIGPLYEKHLHKAGIRTFAQLAKLSPEDVATHIPNLSASQIRKQGWVLQARKLAPKKAASKPRQKKTTVSTISQHYENFTLEFLLNEKNKLRRLRIMHVQSGDIETWAKWNSEEVLHFLARHTGARLIRSISALTAEVHNPVTKSATPNEERLPISKKIVKAPITVTETFNQIPPQVLPPPPQSQPVPAAVINQIDLIKWTNTLSNSNQPISSLPHDQSFDVKLTLDITKARMSNITQLDVTGMLFAKKLGGGLRRAISEVQRVVPYAPIIDVTLDNANLTQGFYRLEALVKLDSNDAAALSAGIDASFAGGLFQVY